ncbi:MAG: HEPN domain-containing protein [Caldilineaceae bacterium]
MPTRVELKELAKTRLQEAKILYDQGLYDGCCYLAGYVLEMALKARICKVLDTADYPETGEISRSFKTHNLIVLLRLAGLQRKLDVAIAANPNLLRSWSLITEWTEEFRYTPAGTRSKLEAEIILSAIEDRKDGILLWLKKYW